MERISSPLAATLTFLALTAGATALAEIEGGRPEQGRDLKLAVHSPAAGADSVTFNLSL